MGLAMMGFCLCYQTPISLLSLINNRHKIEEVICRDLFQDGLGYLHARGNLKWEITIVDDKDLDFPLVVSVDDNSPNVN
eukprot:15162727-Ditylum_brightwellii.AAC.1